MKKLATLFAVASLAIATPVFACPHDEKAETADTAPRTADADKAPKADKAKDTKVAKPADKTKAPEKKAEKVSQK